ncbi:MAG: hypothetical protein JSV43_08920 [Methanobacteriota archaeon]|nr:MAG: hypothetical protein JSV43_08920 [Euryarchaeota archaeon]
MSNTPTNPKKLGSVSTIIALFLMAGFATIPMVAEAPPGQGTLNVTWENLAPDTNTYQGDVNLSMIWLSLEAQNADITLESIQVDIYGFPPEGINRTFVWDDRNYDKNMSYDECVIGESANAPYVLPPVGQMRECTGPDIGFPVVIPQGQSRYFTIYLDLDFDPDQRFTDRDLRACVEDGSIVSSASTVVGLPACSRTIEINTRFFFDDMEHGQGDWEFEGGDDAGIHPTGLWHMTQGEEDCINNIRDMPYYHSYNTSWWYGHRYLWFGDWVCNYYTHAYEQPTVPSRNWGKLRTPWIDARMGTSLTMTIWHFLAREPYAGLDTAEVYLNDTTGWNFITSEWTTDDHWRKLTLNLSDYAGKMVQLEFRFDTIDEKNNMFYGWFIDDLVLYGELMDDDIAFSALTDLPEFIPLQNTTISALVSNIGSSGQTDIEVNLTQNGAVIDLDLIPFLGPGTSMNVSFVWLPPGEGTYVMCVNATPVPGETILWNNFQCTSVNVTIQTITKVAILRSYGTQAQGPRDTWDYLNAHWDNHGLDPILIDYVTLDTYPITYHDISRTQADVLVLSGSGYYFGDPMGRQLNDDETRAIRKWIVEGHGFVTIGTAFLHLVPNHNDLVDLVGIVDQPYVRGGVTTLDVDGACTGHPIFTNVPSQITNGFGYTMTPGNDTSWDDHDLDGGQNCASNENKSASIVIFKGNVMISFAADVTPTEEEKQFLYNTFVWSRFEANDYDVKVSELSAPRFVRPSFPANVRATVANTGKQNLPTVQVDLKVDGTAVQTQTINNLLHGDWERVNFSWLPASEGTYEVCIFADIIGFTDEDPSNNELCTSIQVMINPPVLVYVLDSWGTDFGHLAPWDDLSANWSDYGTEPVYVDYDTFNRESIWYQDLVDSYADVLLISSSRLGNYTEPLENGYMFTNNELDAIVRYTEEGHGLIATGLTFDSEWLPTHGFRLGPLFGMNAGNSYTSARGIHDLSVVNPSENHPLFRNIPDNYDTSNGTTLSPGNLVTDPDEWMPGHLLNGEYKALSTPRAHGAVITNESGNFSAVYITNFVENKSNMNDKQLLYNAMIWARTSVTPPTNLWIYKSGNELRLEWTESTSPWVEGYRIYKATSVNGFDFDVTSGSVPAGTTQWIDPQPDAGIDPFSYFYVVRAYDKAGHEEKNLNKVGKFALQLYKGTNEISIGFELSDHTTSVAFESVAGSYRYIEAFDPYTCIWRVWTPTGGTLTQIHRSMGLRVNMRLNGLLINVGRVTSTSIDLPKVTVCDYWNFVGYPSFETMPLPQVLDDGGMAGKYEMVLFFDPTDKKARWKFFDPNDPDGSTLRELRPGMGIWINVLQAGTWEVKGD